MEKLLTFKDILAPVRWDAASAATPEGRDRRGGQHDGARRIERFVEGLTAADLVRIERAVGREVEEAERWAQAYPRDEELQRDWLALVELQARVVAAVGMGE